MNENLTHFAVARNTRASTALSELVLTAAARLWNLLPSGVFSSGTLSSFKSAVNLCLTAY